MGSHGNESAFPEFDIDGYAGMHEPHGTSIIAEKKMK